MSFWTELKFPQQLIQPVNLFSVPKQDKVCHHTHWAVYYSYKIKQCVDCGEKRDFDGTKIEHQR